MQFVRKLIFLKAFALKRKFFSKNPVVSIIEIYSITAQVEPSNMAANLKI